MLNNINEGVKSASGRLVYDNTPASTPSWKGGMVKTALAMAQGSSPAYNAPAPSWKGGIVKTAVAMAKGGYLSDNFFATGEIHTPSILESYHNGDLTEGQSQMVDMHILDRMQKAGKVIPRSKRGFFNKLKENAGVIGTGVGFAVGGPAGAMIGGAIGGMVAGNQAQKDAQRAGANQVAVAEDQLLFSKEQYAYAKEHLEEQLDADLKRYNLTMDDLQGMLSDTKEESAKYKARIDTNLQKLNSDITNFDMVRDNAIQSSLHTTMQTAENLDLASEATANAVRANNEEYALHKAMFGSTQQNMVDYMNSLNPKDFAANTKAHLNASFAKVMKAVDTTMSRRKVLDSGMYDEQVINRSFDTAQARANADITAETKVADMRMKWLQFGEASKVSLNQGAGIAQQMTGVANATKAGDNQTAMSANLYSSQVSQYKTGVASNQANINNPYTNSLNFINAIHSNPATGVYGGMLGGANAGIGSASANMGNAYGNQATRASGQANNFNSALQSAMVVGGQMLANQSAKTPDFTNITGINGGKAG